MSLAPIPTNEPVLSFAPKSPERETLSRALSETAQNTVEVPLFIGGKRVETGEFASVVMPHEHKTRLARVHQGRASHWESAIQTALATKSAWASLDWKDRAAVFLKAADLLVGPWRDRMNAATMLGQSKTVYQSEIDAIAELADFWRFNVHFYEKLLADQPFSPRGQWNRLELRPLDGFVFAVTPFNFTSIAGNLPTAPALLGNTVVWKPAATQARSALTIMQILEEAGLPPGVIQLVFGNSQMIAKAILESPDLGGIHFTGSTAVFQGLWSTVGSRIAEYKQYPRLVGETGGKDFIFAHESADVASLACAIVRGGFEYQGQKCSAASRVYAPKSLWPSLKASLVEQLETVKMGDPRDFSNFMGAVIDEKAFHKISEYIGLAKNDSECSILSGGTFDKSVGYFIRPTLVETTNPKHRLMREEIFGPVVTVFVYDDSKLEDTLRSCDEASPYALTGAIFAQDRNVIAKLSARLSGAAGNFYVNDKPTGAVVGQQPFGGSRASGTNDKAGSAWNLMRWASPRAIKENFDPPTVYPYPHMQG